MSGSGSAVKRPGSPTEPPVGKTSNTRRKLEMPLEVVPNVLDDATHQELDKKVLGEVDFDPSTISRATFLLSTIVKHSEGTLDQKYSDIADGMTLLREQSELWEILKVAWKDRSFKLIRNLSTSFISYIERSH
jgi:hypothetical protein